MNEQIIKLLKDQFNDQSRLTGACDKQFVSLDDFKENAIKFLEKEK